MKTLQMSNAKPWPAAELGSLIINTVSVNHKVKAQNHQVNLIVVIDDD
jgi:hypothetical protein